MQISLSHSDLEVLLHLHPSLSSGSIFFWPVLLHPHRYFCDAACTYGKPQFSANNPSITDHGPSPSPNGQGASTGGCNPGEKRHLPYGRKRKRTGDALFYHNFRASSGACILPSPWVSCAGRAQPPANNSSLQAQGSRAGPQ